MGVCRLLQLAVLVVALSVGVCQAQNGQSAGVQSASVQSGPLAGRAASDWQAHPLQHVAVSPDGRHFAVASSQTVVLWQLQPHAPVRALFDTRHEDTPTQIVNIAGLEFTSDGRAVIVRTRRGSIGSGFTRLTWIDIASGALQGSEQEVPGHEHGQTISADGTQFVLWSSAGTSIVDRDNGHSVSPVYEFNLPRHGRPPDSRGIRYWYRIWPLPDKKHGVIIQSHSYQVIDLATVAPVREFSACTTDRVCGAPRFPYAIGDGSKFVAAGGFTFGVGLWDIASGRLLKRIEPFKKFADATAISARTDRLAINNDTGGIRIAIIGTANLDIERVIDAEMRVQSLAFTRDGPRLLVAGGHDKGKLILSLWDVQAGKRLWSLDRR